MAQQSRLTVDNNALKNLTQEAATDTLKILLIEDNPGDARLLQAMLQDAALETDSPFPAWVLRQAACLQTALDFLEQEYCDVILLDLNLPDSQGLDTFIHLKAKSPDAVVVVLTGLSDNQLATQAIRQGAQDYLVKDKLDGDVLLRSLRYAIERQRLQIELERIKQQQLQEQELRSLEQLSGFKPGDRDAVQKLLHDYAGLVQSYVKATRLHQARPSAKVQMLAWRLAKLQARARDVVRLHLNVLEGIGSWAKPAEERAFANDARLVLVELMGHLIDIYLEKQG